MSRAKGKTTPINFRFPNHLLDKIDSRVGTSGDAENRTDFVIHSVEKALKDKPGEVLFLDTDVADAVDKARENSIPPSSRATVVNWVLRKFFKLKEK